MSPVAGRPVAVDAYSREQQAALGRSRFWCNALASTVWCQAMRRVREEGLSAREAVDAVIAEVLGIQAPSAAVAEEMASFFRRLSCT